jgi:molybdopterin/thiamine biosynthesis adenylyltransferase
LYLLTTTIHLSFSNIKEMVAQSDFVFDTIDFLELVSIVALHDEAHAQKKPLVSGTTAGWGAMALYFPPSDAPFCGFRRLFDLPLSEEVRNESYVEHYKHLIGRISGELEPVVVEVMAKALTVMEDGKPCPASQVSVGSASLAALASTLLVRILDGQKVTTAPHLVVANISASTTGEGIDLER